MHRNSNSYDRAPFLLDRLNLLLKSPAFFLTFDIGHNAGANFTDEPIILEHTEKLRHLHIHDAVGRSHHLPLGDGKLEIEKYLELMNTYNCRAVLEIKTVEGLWRSVNWLHKRGTSRVL